MIEHVWLVHPDLAMCNAFRRHFEGLRARELCKVGLKTSNRTTVS